MIQKAAGVPHTIVNGEVLIETVLRPASTQGRCSGRVRGRSKTNWSGGVVE